MIGRDQLHRARRMRAFFGDRRGNVAVIFSLCLLPLMGLVGAAVDYARASKAKSQLNMAVDAAALAAVQKISGDYADRQQAAYGSLEANLANSPLDSVSVTVTDTVLADGSKGVVVDASGVLGMSVAKVIGFSTMNIASRAEAVGGGSPAEIALVLDNTGSMINDMPALKLAAKNFVHTVFAASAGNVKMSVVPYVAAVNVGQNFPPSMLELTGMAQFQGMIYKGAYLAWMNGCAVAPVGPPSPPPPPAPPGPPPPPVGTPSGKDKSVSLEQTPDVQHAGVWTTQAQRARAFAQTLFGVSRAAADVTANSIDPILTYSYTPPAPPYVAGIPTSQVPVGYDIYGCTLWHHGAVSNMELFNRMPGATWKGCVEARRDPYDVTDEGPSAGAVNTMFVPYFAPDEPDSPAAPNGFRNNYLNDLHTSWVPNGGNPAGWSNIDRFHTMFKYDRVNRPTIAESGPNTVGPNANCPDPLQRLTSNQGRLIAKINSLNYWGGGGTISSEGLMWGWRTISPWNPFQDGGAYGGTTKKHIVLMTDGLNSLVENNPPFYPHALSDYSAYGNLAQGRMGGYPATFLKAEAFLNERMLTACTNAKAKGISIYTILFRETDTATKDLLKTCASTPAQALQANDSASLQTAFQSIAGQISSVRLSK